MPLHIPLSQLTAPRSPFLDLVPSYSSPATFVAMGLGKFEHFYAVTHNGAVWSYQQSQLHLLHWKTRRPVDAMDVAVGVKVGLTRLRIFICLLIAGSLFRKTRRWCCTW